MPNLNTAGLRSLGQQQIASFSTAKGWTVPSGTTLALVTAETNAVRWRDDGTAPTASVGYPLAVGSELAYDVVVGSPGWEQMLFIPQTGSATLDITYYGP